MSGFVSARPAVVFDGLIRFQVLTEEGSEAFQAGQAESWITNGMGGYSPAITREPHQSLLLAILASFEVSED